ncbi:MAG: outer-membrane lipoprotein carrier protein LolA [Prevotella sp.]|jgi:outer membrane lipoprotein-sorting protein|nr:outer-membrane lipoprotein carrier protein LolA [Prevotella sp.]
MKTRLFTLITLFTFILSASAQDARSILDKASEAYSKAGAVTVTFTLDSKDTKAKTTYSYDGKAFMKGDKFKLEIPDAVTWFDGTTQWVYVKDTEEVNISNPTGEELQGISPSVLFSIYKKGYNLTYKGEKKLGGKTVQEVELTPQKKNADIAKIVVQIDKANNTFHKISLTDKVGMLNSLTINSYQTGGNIPDSTFSFNKKEYPRAEIVDLR